jgi:hypothetical protein
MDRKFSLPNLREFKVPLAVRLIISGLFLVRPLMSCSSDHEQPPVIRSTSVPDDGYHAPQTQKPNTNKNKPKIVSFRKHEPANV